MSATPIAAHAKMALRHEREQPDMPDKDIAVAALDKMSRAVTLDETREERAILRHCSKARPTSKQDGLFRMTR